MSIKKHIPIDDSGNEIPAPDPTTDVGQIIYLLEWGRLRGFLIGPTVQVGDTIVQVKDLRLQADRDQKNSPALERTIWQEAGHDDE